MTDNIPARPWGYIRADGVFRALPMAPLVATGETPPFGVELPSGEVRRIVVEPEDADDVW